MKESGWYPPGAEFDPNAPYNQSDVTDYYEADAAAQIDEEIDNSDDTFLDWAYDNDYLPDDYSDDDLKRVVNDKSIRDEYYHYRLYDVCLELAEKEADEIAYQESEAYEAYRERCLLGE